jgi:hypothetical protein
MKTMTIPPLRVSAELRRQAEAVLVEGETLSSFGALDARVAERLDQQEFLARGLASAAKARRTQRNASAEAVIDKLSARLARARTSR